MRKNSPRKWLHAILDLLPVMLIPVFMIYSHRHTLTESTDVEIQYKYQSNEVDSLDDLIYGNIYELNIQQHTLDDVMSLTDDSSFQFILLQVKEYDFDNYGLNIDDEITSWSQINYFDVINKMVFYTSISYYQVYLNDWENDDYFVQLEIGDLTSRSFTLNAIIQLVDFDMIPSFSYDILTYTDYNIIESVNVVDTNSSITSAFLNNFNDTIQAYFNFGNVFNFGNIWNWFNSNIFGGNAPSIVYSVWCIVLYEFIMDLIFLIYGLFMFFIDFCTNLIDRFHVKCSGGK